MLFRSPAAQPDASTVTYTVTGGTNVDSTVESGILTLTTKGSPGAGTEESITVTTATKNYSTATFTIKVQYTDKTPVTLTAIPATDLVYDGTAKTAAASGAPEYKFTIRLFIICKNENICCITLILSFNGGYNWVM